METHAKIHTNIHCTLYGMRCTSRTRKCYKLNNSAHNHINKKYKHMYCAHICIYELWAIVVVVTVVECTYVRNSMRSEPYWMCDVTIPTLMVQKLNDSDWVWFWALNLWRAWCEIYIIIVCQYGQITGFHILYGVYLSFAHTRCLLSSTFFTIQ